MPERKIEYQNLHHKADLGFLVKAPSWQRLYIDAALCLTDLRVKLDSVRDPLKRQTQVSATSKEELLTAWLNEILILADKERFLPKRIVFDRFDGKLLNATLWGELHEPARHGHLSPLKPITTKQLQLGENHTPEPHFFARVLF